MCTSVVFSSIDINQHTGVCESTLVSLFIISVAMPADTGHEDVIF